MTTGGALNSPLGLTLAPGGAGTLFGLAITPSEKGVYFVGDGTNQLGLFTR